MSSTSNSEIMNIRCLSSHIFFVESPVLIYSLSTCGNSLGIFRGISVVLISSYGSKVDSAFSKGRHFEIQLTWRIESYMPEHNPCITRCKSRDEICHFPVYFLGHLSIMGSTLLPQWLCANKPTSLVDHYIKNCLSWLDALLISFHLLRCCSHLMKLF